MVKMLNTFLLSNMKTNVCSSCMSLFILNMLNVFVSE
jgi:hypothetical protein